MKYGQQDFDFNEGIMFFMSPGQVLRIEMEEDTVLKQSGWMLLVHPDFLWNTPLGIALWLWPTTIAGIMQSIQQEYHSNINKFTDKPVAEFFFCLFY